MQVLKVSNLDKQRHCKPVAMQGKFSISMSFMHSIYITHIAIVVPDIKIFWFAFTWVCFFERTCLVRKSFSFLDEEGSIILIYLT